MWWATKNVCFWLLCRYPSITFLARAGPAMTLFCRLISQKVEEIRVRKEPVTWMLALKLWFHTLLETSQIMIYSKSDCFIWNNVKGAIRLIMVSICLKSNVVWDLFHQNYWLPTDFSWKLQFRYGIIDLRRS